MEKEIKYVCCVIEKKNANNLYDTVSFPFVDEEEIDGLFNTKGVIKVFTSTKLTTSQILAKKWIEKQIEIEKSKIENYIDKLLFPN